MNFVTYETAVRLKEAGFPQPRPQLYQAWYWFDAGVRSALPYILTRSYSKIGEGDVFAPTADDILRELPGFAICYLEDFAANMVFCVFLRRHPEQFPTHHENPAEACALAWIEFHKK